MPKKIHITTAIFYCNAAPHVGSAYEALAADVYARYQRRKLGARAVSFLTGTDEHGDKIRRAAAERNLDPKSFTDRMSKIFRDAWTGLNVSFDYFVRTTDAVHVEFVRKMLARTYERGDIYFKDYEGTYCVACERFYAERELVDGRICPVHNRPVELISEGNYFLKIDKYRREVITRIQNDPDFIRPERYRNEALNMLAEPLADLCISRPKARLEWGIELPFDPDYVTYVWYDAFWAYVSTPAEEDPGFVEETWPLTEHFIGKDILKTHAVYWPPILLAAGLPLFRRLNVHGWVNFGGHRMSKSSGNVADPVTFETAFGRDVLRYFLMREVVFGLDGDFSEERLIERYNADLANDLGNLASRILSMAERYHNSRIETEPQRADILTTPDSDTGKLLALGTPSEPAGGGELFKDQALCAIFTGLPPKVGALVESLEFNRALETIWQALDFCNKYIVMTSPFTLAKKPESMPRVAQILANLLEALRITAVLLEPFMPKTAEKIFDRLNLSPSSEEIAKPFGEGLKKGHQLKPPTALFPRIDKSKPT